MFALAGCGSSSKPAITRSQGPKPPPAKHLAQGVDYSGTADVGGKPVKVQVRMTPLTFARRAMAKGRQRARIQYRIKNLGPMAFKDTVGAFALVDANANLYTEVISSAFRPSLAGVHGAIVIPPGATRTGYIAYQVPANVKITGATFTSSVTSDQLSWQIP